LSPLDVPAERRVAIADQPVACLQCGSRITGICASLDAAGLDELSHEAQRASVKARETLFHEGDAVSGVLMIVKGMAKLSRLMADGRQQVLGFRFSGDILGLTHAATHAAEAEMLTDGTVCRLTKAQLEVTLQRHPTLQRRLLDLCLREVALTQDQLVTVGRRQAEQRVAAFLLSLSEAARRRGHSAQALDMPMTRSEIGDLLGLALETVSRAFTALRKRGLLTEPGGHKVLLTDLDTLEMVADG